MPKNTSVRAVESDEYVTMKAQPPWEDIDCVEYFYDGEITVEKGVCRVPKNRPEWISRMRMNGYEEINP